jgi:hypothetical protein
MLLKLLKRRKWHLIEDAPFGVAGSIEVYLLKVNKTIGSALVQLCVISASSAPCMLRHVIIDRVFCSSGRSLLAISRGCNRPMASWRHEPVAERWSLHPFSINPNSCLAPQSPNSARPGKEN